MTLAEANRIRKAFYRKSIPTEEDLFAFTEAMGYIIRETGDPYAMLELGGQYYEERKFDLACKYYEMAAEYRITDAYICLGYIWYYGRTGQRDYEKALHYYSLAADAGSINGAYKLADMYKNGYGVEKSYDRYVRIIESLYPQVTKANDTGDHRPEIFIRLAGIRAKQGRADEAVTLYREAKGLLAERIEYNAFFGNLNMMMWLIDDLYSLTEFDPDDMDLYDLYYLLKGKCRVRFRLGRQTCEVETDEEDGMTAVRFGDRWFRGREEFFSRASVDGELLTSRWRELYDFTVEDSL